jgi:hypothetical protein
MTVGRLQSRYCTDTPHVSRSDIVLNLVLQVAEVAGVVLAGDRVAQGDRIKHYLA